MARKPQEGGMSNKPKTYIRIEGGREDVMIEIAPYQYVSETALKQLGRRT
jgi:hypothetical protein